ncbi:MAG: LuxR C-terminal-related transcriptional regulator, partial [Thermodesulfobacteriota bacterium]
SEKARLDELNITLRHVMKNIDQERQELQKAVAHKVRDILLPAVEKVDRESSPQVRKGYLDIIRDQMLTLAAGNGAEQDSRLLKLTPNEMKICQFIQAGSSSKDIAESMSLSVETVQTHRRNIRKKLGLRGQNVNLHTFLKASKPDAALTETSYIG